MYPIRNAGRAGLALALILADLFHLPDAGAAAGATPLPPRVFLIGGSTMATFPPERPVVGWGQILPDYFVTDDTHYCAHGARQVAALAAGEIRRLGLPLAKWLQDPPSAT